jgi:hypothetical protein
MPHTTVRVFQASDGDKPLAAWLDELEEREPRAHTKCLAYILRLSQFGYELRRPMADSLRDGIRELRPRVGTVNYRMLYFFYGQNAACLSHGLTKAGPVPDPEIDTAVRRKRLVERDPDKYTADWEV